MALSASTVWEVRTTGNDGNGGGFVTGSGGTDFSQQDAAQAVLTVASVLGPAANQVTVAGGDYTCVAGDVGNILQITGGTATAGFYHITARAGQVWTLDRNAGAIGNTVVGAMGGGLASPAVAAPPMVNGNILFIKAGTYSMSVNTNNVANGKWSKSAPVLVIGYDTNRAWGNVDTKPILQATVTLTTMWTGSSNWVNNIVFDVNSQASTRSVSGGAYTRCEFNNGNLANVQTLATHCTATGNSATSFTDGAAGFFYCEAFGNTATGFSCSNASLHSCLSYDNSGATSDGFINPSLTSAHFFNCIAYNNGRDGFRNTTGSLVSRMILQNCIAEDNAGIGINAANTQYPSIAIRCSVFNNGTDTAGGLTEVDTLTPGGSVFTNAAAGDFSLNNTGGAGATLRAAGYIEFDSNVFPAGLTTSYLDVGVAQHQDTGGGGGGEHSAVF
jgi:hypothetical protein